MWLWVWPGEGGVDPLLTVTEELVASSSNDCVKLRFAEGCE